MFVARVTADVDTLSQFMEWGGIAWIISFAHVFGALALMLVYSWQLTIAVVLLVIPLLLVVSSLQGRLTQAFDLVRTRVGAAAVRGLRERHGRGRRPRLRAGGPHRPAGEARDRRAVPSHDRGALALGDAVPDRRRSSTRSRSRSSLARRHSRAGMGSLVRTRHRVHLPVGRLPARVHRPAGGLRRHADRDRGLAEDPDGARPADRDRRAGRRGRAAARGPIAVRTTALDYSYREGGPVLRGISRRGGPRDAHVAIVGETGGGKTTFAKLLSRLADPASGDIEVDGVDLPPGVARLAARRDPHGPAGRVPVRHHGARERPVRAARRERPRRRDRVRGAGPGRLGRRAPAGPRHPGGRAGRGALRRRAPAGLAGARADRPARAC